MIVDLGEYLVVAIATGYGGSADSVISIRCNRRSTAEKLTEFLQERYGSGVAVFEDPPKIGQGSL